MTDKCNKTTYATTITGITTDQFVLMEQCFSVCINVFEKVDKDIVIPVYKSSHSYGNVNMYDKHSSYFQYYAKTFQCKLCDKLFVCMSKLTQHEQKCDKEESTVSFKGGYFNSRKYLLQELELFGHHLNKSK